MRESSNLGVVVTASLAGLLFGFDTVVISGVTESVRTVFHLEARQLLVWLRSGQRAARHIRRSVGGRQAG